MEYFSDSERGRKAQIEARMSPDVLAGIVAHIQSLISIGAFGEHFPDVCPDGAVPIGTDERSFSQALKAEVPDIEWPLKIRKDQGDYSSEEKPYAPDTIVALDLVQFCYMHVSKPIQGGYHSFLNIIICLLMPRQVERSSKRRSIEFFPGMVLHMSCKKMAL